MRYYRDSDGRVIRHDSSPEAGSDWDEVVVLTPDELEYMLDSEYRAGISAGMYGD